MTASKAERDALAAKLFPREWAAVAMRLGASKKRNQLRKRAEEKAARDAAIAPHIAAGHCCGNCNEFEPYPGPGNKDRFICAMDSDFRGYAIARADGLCPLWRARK